MDRNIRYQLLPEEDREQVDVETAEVTDPRAETPPPPLYEEVAESTSISENAGATGSADATPVPPPYTVATELPSYDEAERTKHLESLHPGTWPTQVTPSQPQTTPTSSDNTLLGTDCIFIGTFLLAFVLNWIGFFLSLCISSTVAGRCGALAGLGLSIVNLSAILKESDIIDSYISSSDTWIWWILMFCGFVVFFRGCIQYFQIKYQWRILNGDILPFRLFRQ